MKRQTIIRTGRRQFKTEFTGKWMAAVAGKCMKITVRQGDRQGGRERERDRETGSETDKAREAWRATGGETYVPFEAIQRSETTDKKRKKKTHRRQTLPKDRTRM